MLNSHWHRSILDTAGSTCHVAGGAGRRPRVLSGLKGYDCEPERSIYANVALRVSELQIVISNPLQRSVATIIDVDHQLKRQFGMQNDTGNRQLQEFQIIPGRNDDTNLCFLGHSWLFLRGRLCDFGVSRTFLDAVSRCPVVTVAGSHRYI